MAGSYWVVTDEIVQTAKGPKQVHTIFGGRKFISRMAAERFKDNLDCPSTIHYLDTVQVSEATRKLRAMGVLGAMREGKDWRGGMVKFRRGR